MRLFIAIDPPETIKKKIIPLLQDLPTGKTTPENQLHLTLRFLGEVPETDLDTLEKGLQSIQVKAFSLSFKGVGCFPSEKRPRILWLGTPPTPPLLKLKEAIDLALEAQGFAREGRSFKPHLTLARFKNPHPGRLQNFLTKHLAFQTEGFDVKACHLYSSQLTPKGAIHRKEFSLSLMD